VTDFFNWKKSKIKSFGSPEAKVFLAILVSEWVFLSFFGDNNQRYFIVAMPALFALFLVQTSAWPKLLVLSILGANLLVGQYSWWRPEPESAVTEYNRSYEDAVKLLASGISRTITENGPKHLIVDRWFVNNALKKPYLGYVERPISTFQILSGRTTQDEIRQHLLGLPKDIKIGWLHLNLGQTRLENNYFVPIRKSIFADSCQTEKGEFASVQICSTP